jgi:riboflavin kinase / FMN adenylyltransferase
MEETRFTAGVVSGSGRGKNLGTPTLNLNLADVPSSLQEGIYACFATIDGMREQAAMHYGPRPVFKDTTSCEVHLLDRTLTSAPASVTVEIIERLRDVQDFPSPAALMDQIARDIERTRAILNDA